jgi:hypothetical protein
MQDFVRKCNGQFPLANFRQGCIKLDSGRASAEIYGSSAL